MFEKHGLERFNPEGEVFDPNEHQAVYEVDDATKTPGTVGVVLKVSICLDAICLSHHIGNSIFSFRENFVEFLKRSNYNLHGLCIGCKRWFLSVIWQMADSYNVLILYCFDFSEFARL